MSEIHRFVFDLSDLDQKERDDFEDVRVEVGAQRDAAEMRALGLDPASAAVVIGGIVVLGRMFASLWERWNGGTVIELTAKGPKIYRDRTKVAFGFFVIIPQDGQEVSIEAKDEPKDALERMGEALLKLPLDASTEIVKATLQAAASKAEVVTS